MRQRYRSITKRGLRGVRDGRGSRAARLVALERQNGQSGSSVLRILGFGAIGLGVAIFVGLLLTFIAGLATWNYFSADLPNLNSVEARQFETTRIYDRDWRLLYEVNDPVTGFRTYSSYDGITGSGSNMHLVNATVSAEDSSFWQNFGVDPLAIVRGAYINVFGEGVSGGSTITQQLVRQLYPETIGYERTYVRKMREAIVAMQLTDSYSKEEILEMYFNSVYYGNRAYGIDAAARTYFDKEPSELTLAEAALLAGLPQAPSAYDPTQNMAAAKERQRYVLNQMISEGYISRQEAEAAWNEVLVIHPQRNRSMLAPHWVNFVIAELEREYGAEAVYRGGLSVRTSLDYELQVKAQESIREHLEQLKPYNANNGALVARLPATGEIVAMVGSNDYWDDSISGQFNVATSEQQPGGAFMPLVYAAAFEQGWHPGRVILDYETRYSTPGAPVPEYVPENTTRMFHGAVTAREALARSLNVPAVKALDQVGVAGLIDLAHQMGIRTGLWRGLDFYGLALALGSGEVSLLELTDTYATFANNGRYVPHNAILEIVGPNNNVMYALDREQTLEQGQQVIRPETGYLISDILSDTEAREAAFGADNVLEFPELGNRPIAAKTGTSFDWFDNWTVGYSTDLTVGVWIGNAGNQPLEQLDAMSGAAPIFHEFMVEAHQPEYADTLSGPGLPPTGPEFARPEGITEMEVCSPTGGLPIPGTDTYSLMLDEQARPKTRCDQLTRQQWIELQSALRQYSEDSSRFTQEGIESLLAYAEAVRGGVSIPNQSAEPAATVTPTAQPSPTVTPRPSPTPRPTVTPWIPPTATPVPPPPTATPDVPPTPTESQQSGPVVVPDLYGMTQSQAAAALANRDLSVGEVIPLTQEDLPPGLNITEVDVGEVYFQSPAPGSSVSRFSTVSIAVRAE